MANSTIQFSMESLNNEETAVVLEQNLAQLRLNDGMVKTTTSTTMNQQPKIICEELIFDDDDDNSDDDDDDELSSFTSTSLSSSSSSSYEISSNSALSVPTFFESLDRKYEKRRPPFHHQHSHTKTIRI